MQNEIDIRSYIDVLRRRYLFLLIPTVVATAVAVLVALQMPKAYESTAVILIEDQQIPQTLVSPTVTAGAFERIAVLRQKLMTRENLLTVADKFSLFTKNGTRPAPTRLVEAVRESITIGQIDIGGRRSANVIGFTVTFRYSDATVATQVANELVNTILAENIQNRLGQAAETSRFFRSELSQLEEDLDTLEDRIVAFKQENARSLPDTLPYRRAELLRLSTEIDDLNRQVRIAQQGAVDFTNDAALRSLDRRLRTRKLELVHVEEERATLAPLADKDIIPKSRIRSIDREIARIKLDIEMMEAEAAAAGLTAGGQSVLDLEHRRDELKRQAQELNDSILETPRTEAQLNGLSREHESLRSEYRQAQERLADAVAGERLEEDRRAERFVVIEPATRPEAPVNPNQKTVVLAGAAGGFGLGFAALFLVEFLNRSVRTAGDLEKRLQIRPLASIPYVTTPRETRRRRLRLMAASTAAVLAIVFALAGIHLFYRPLDLLVSHVL